MTGTQTESGRVRQWESGRGNIPSYSTGFLALSLPRSLAGPLQNLNGIPSFSPGLARNELPWVVDLEIRTTLKGLNQSQRWLGILRYVGDLGTGPLGGILSSPVLSGTSASSLRRLRTAFIPFVVLSFTHFAFSAEDEIPPLRPPRGELHPGFWEQHAWQVALAAVAFLGLLALLFALRRGPKPAPVQPPEIIARSALEALRGRAEDPALISEVSRVLRLYVIAAFGLPPDELTTTEIQKALGNREAEPQIGDAVIGFLRQCDESKFAPATSAPQSGTVTRALELVNQISSATAPAPVQVPSR